MFRISSDRHLRNLASQDSASISGSKTPYLQIGITLPFQDTFHHFRMTWLIFAVKFQVSMLDESSQVPRARKSKLASGYILIKLHLTWTCILVLDLYAASTFDARHAHRVCPASQCDAPRHGTSGAPQPPYNRAVAAAPRGSRCAAFFLNWNMSDVLHNSEAASCVCGTGHSGHVMLLAFGIEAKEF